MIFVFSKKELPEILSNEERKEKILYSENNFDNNKTINNSNNYSSNITTINSSYNNEVYILFLKYFF